MTANLSPEIVLIFGIVWTGVGTYLAWFRPALFRRITAEPVVFLMRWDSSSVRWYRSGFNFWLMQIGVTVMFLACASTLLIVSGKR